MVSFSPGLDGITKWRLLSFAFSAYLAGNCCERMSLLERLSLGLARFAIAVAPRTAVVRTFLTDLLLLSFPCAISYQKEVWLGIWIFQDEISNVAVLQQIVFLSD